MILRSFPTYDSMILCNRGLGGLKAERLGDRGCSSPGTGCPQDGMSPGLGAAGKQHLQATPLGFSSSERKRPGPAERCPVSEGPPRLCKAAQGAVAASVPGERAGGRPGTGESHRGVWDPGDSADNTGQAFGKKKKTRTNSRTTRKPAVTVNYCQSDTNRASGGNALNHQTKFKPFPASASLPPQGPAASPVPSASAAAGPGEPLAAPGQPTSPPGTPCPPLPWPLSTWGFPTSSRC